MGTAADPKQGTRLARPLEEYLRALYYDEAILGGNALRLLGQA